MTDPTADFYALWRQFQRNTQDAELPLCPLAAEFGRKVEDIIFGRLGASPTRAEVAQAQFMLQHEYFAWWKAVPGHHVRTCPKTHRCLHAVYEMSYDRLHLLELTVRPPVALIADYYDVPTAPPPPQPPQPPPRIAGIFLGEEE